MAKLAVDKTRRISSDQVICPACGSVVKKRGLRNHQQSDYCKAHQRRMEAEQAGLTPLTPSMHRIFVKYKIPCEDKMTKVFDGKNAIHLRPRITSEYWGAADVVETVKSCLRVKSDKVDVYMQELDEWIGKCALECLESGEMPEEVKIADSIVRLKRLAEQEDKENGEI